MNLYFIRLLESSIKGNSHVRDRVYVLAPTCGDAIERLIKEGCPERQIAEVLLINAFEGEFVTVLES
ncbi:MAG: hypothetical protein KGL39_12590 [Patescibacteria group bacterium]|nr:hypothetical protein [Patescibacteria group bacterium]